MNMTTYIDRNRLLDEIEKKKYSRSSRTLIMNQPAADVIPVEWLHKWWEKETITYSAGYDGWYEVEGFMFRYEAMIEAWRKENEISISN